MSVAELDKIATEFNSTVFKLVKICKRLEPGNADLAWLQNNLSLARDLDPLMIINSCKDIIWEYREHIMNEDEKFFLSMDARKKVANTNDEETKIALSLISSIKEKYPALSQGEKKQIWSHVKNLLEKVVLFMKMN